jgi:pterin-4a-carbinolamine dehydratase
MPTLTAKQVGLHLKAVPNWSKRAKTILRTFKFEGFLDSIAFVNRIKREPIEPASILCQRQLAAKSA